MYIFKYFTLFFYIFEPKFFTFELESNLDVTERVYGNETRGCDVLV